MKLALSLALWTILFCTSSPAAPTKALPSAKIQGQTVQLEPSKFSFRIPESWVRWNNSNSKSLHLSREEIKKTENAEGEWDKQFSTVANSIFSIDQCAAHLGSEGWGRDSVAFGDLQMRAYISDWSVSQVESRVKNSGVVAASKFSKETVLKKSRVGSWQISTLSFPLWFGDYGATAQMDFYSQTFRKQTVTLVFMHTDFQSTQEKERNGIVASFKAQKLKHK